MIWNLKTWKLIKTSLSLKGSKPSDNKILSIWGLGMPFMLWKRMIISREINTCRKGNTVLTWCLCHHRPVDTIHFNRWIWILIFLIPVLISIDTEMLSMIFSSGWFWCSHNCLYINNWRLETEGPCTFTMAIQMNLHIFVSPSSKCTF